MRDANRRLAAGTRADQAGQVAPAVGCAEEPLARGDFPSSSPRRRKIQLRRIARRCLVHVPPSLLLVLFRQPVGADLLLAQPFVFGGYGPEGDRGSVRATPDRLAVRVEDRLAGLLKVLVRGLAERTHSGGFASGLALADGGPGGRYRRRRGPLSSFMARTRDAWVACRETAP